MAILALAFFSVDIVTIAWRGGRREEGEKKVLFLDLIFLMGSAERTGASFHKDNHNSIFSHSTVKS